MRKILAGIETEYGLLVEGRGAEDQVDDSMALVRSYPGECHLGWDYRYESPRSDLRGFRLERLAIDPEDAKFDVGRSIGRDSDVRADRVLPNGARFYNDHGHPEYATPECFSLEELALHDCAGQIAVNRAARAYAESSGRAVWVYKNNTDFHGASYGTHESYLVPRRLGFEGLFGAIVPMLIVRQILTGAGKVGSESGRSATYQLSQRADFFVEPANAETLYRRPIFNTRDEPHADPREWIRLHVISGDANMIPSCTARKAGLVKLALHLAEAGTCPPWKISDPVRTFQSISRDESFEFRIELEGRSWTTAQEVLESYLAAAERTLDLPDEFCDLISTCRRLLADLFQNPAEFRKHVDWAAKKHMLESYMEQEGLNWRDPSLQAYDLEYHNVDPQEGLHAALAQMGEVEPDPPQVDLLACLEGVNEPTRAYARALAVRKFGPDLQTLCWRSLTFQHNGALEEVDLPPAVDYPAQLGEAADVGTFIAMLRGVK